MSLTRSLTEAHEALDGSPAARTRFAVDRQWLEERRGQWAQSCWRIGLIGVTSAGKSTLLNALLGDDLLPTDVRPSSNGLVVCRRGDRIEATVYYATVRDRQRGPERISRDYKKRLRELGDESHNPGNRAGVKEIHLQTPGFLLGDGVAMIDSPGLDAYALDDHEAVTLKLLLPTLDIAVFLTTVKANSDQQMAEYVETVREAGKPVVIVQNMLDTIEPKLGFGGVVVKNRKEVAEEHLRRVKRVLERAGHPHPDQVPIIQVSARAALKPETYANSNLDAVVAALKDYVEKVAPGLENGRRRQLIKHLQDVCNQEGATDAQSEKSATRERAALDAKELEIRSGLADLTAALGTLAKDVESSAAGFVRRAERLGPNQHGPADALVQAAKTWGTSVAKKVHELLDQVLTVSRAFARGLNMRPEDYALPPLQSPKSSSSLTVPTNTVLIPRKVPKAGLIPWFKRLFGGDGYDTVYDGRRDVDVRQLSRSS